MSKHFLIILLLISLAFNLAVMCIFAYGSIYHRPLFSPPEWGRDMHNRNMGMGFHNIRHGRHWPDTLMVNKDEIRQLRLAFSQDRRAFMRELRNDKFDINKAKAAMLKSLEAQTKLEKTLGESMIQLREKMTSQQASKFFQEMRNRHDNDNPPRRNGEATPPRPEPNDRQGEPQ